jgi:SPP1 Gp6-like portal protein
LPTMTPGAWLARLEAQLERQQKAIKLSDDYYDGRHRLAFATAKFRQTFGAMFTALSSNWCPNVVDAAVDRLTVWGFRFGEDEAADHKAWDIWQANNLDSESIVAHTEAGKLGAAYIMVAPAPRGSKYPQITIEHPAQVVVEHAAANIRHRLAALKKWRGEDGYDNAVVYLPDRIYKFRSKEKKRSTGSMKTRDWIARPGDPGGVNPLGVVPIIPLFNKRKLLGGGVSDLITAIPLQDAINKELADMLVASEFAAFPQRVAMGIEVPTDSSTGLPTAAAQLEASIARFWVFEDKDAKIAEFSAADLENYVKAITMLLQHLSAQTRTPPHYLLGQMVNISGDALAAAETGLTKRVERKQIDYADAWEEALRLAFKLMDDNERALDLGAETIWKPAAMRSESQIWDAASKMRDVGLPYEAIWEYAGMTPRQVVRYQKLAGLPATPPPGSTSPLPPTS